MAATVTVACKIPNGLTVDHEGQTVTFGGAHTAGSVGGFGLTPNVDAEWFSSWFATAQENKFAPVTSGAIFANSRQEAVEKQAAERADDIKTGLEPLNGQNPEADKRVPEGIVKPEKAK